MKMIRVPICVALGIALLSTTAAAQSASAVVAAASKTMGVDGLNSIVYYGTARMAAFGQSKAIGDPMDPVNVTEVGSYSRAINFGQPTAPTALVSRATGATQPPTVPGAPVQPAGTLNQ